MANLDQFISTVKNGMQLAYNFDVQFTGPAAAEARDLSLLCEEVTVPGMSLATNPVFTYGEPREVVYNRVFEPANFTFLVDINSTALTFFRSWIDKIIDPNTKLVSYYNDYIGTVAIKHLDNGRLRSAGDNTPKTEVYEVVLQEAFPKSIQSYTLSNNTKDILRFSVTMNYKYWERRRVIVPPIQSPRVVSVTAGGLPR
jgi:hypothetical protein